jgi:hypothetical protein
MFRGFSVRSVIPIAIGTVRDGIVRTEIMEDSQKKSELTY